MQGDDYSEWASHSEGRRRREPIILSCIFWIVPKNFESLLISLSPSRQTKTTPPNVGLDRFDQNSSRGERGAPKTNWIVALYFLLEQDDYREMHVGDFRERMKRNDGADMGIASPIMLCDEDRNPPHRLMPLLQGG